MTLHDLIYTFVASFIALFPVINPIGDGFMVHGYLRDLDDAQRKTVARRIFLNCLCVGLGSLVLGHFVLMLFGLAVPAIQVAGGILICKTGYDMLSTSDADTVHLTPAESKTMNTGALEDRLFYPLSFPICLGPGSISVIFTLMASGQKKGDWFASGVHYAIIAVAIVVMLLLLWLILLQGPRLMKKLGHSGNLIISKFIAFITFCVGIQIIIQGIAKIFSLITTL